MVEHLIQFECCGVIHSHTPCILYIKATVVSIYLSDKQGRAGAVTLAFPGRYLLAAPHEFLDQSDGFVCLW